MTEQETIKRIAQNKQRVTNLLNEKSKLNKDLEELDLLKNKFSNLLSNFDGMQSKRKNTLNKYMKKGIHSKIYRQYISGMSNMLSNGEYANCCNGVGEAKRKINNKMGEILNKIETLDIEIKKINNKTNLYNRELIELRKEKKNGC